MAPAWAPTGKPSGGTEATEPERWMGWTHTTSDVVRSVWLRFDRQLVGSVPYLKNWFPRSWFRFEAIRFVARFVSFRFVSFRFAGITHPKKLDSKTKTL